jgi:hypothetical protein
MKEILSENSSESLNPANLANKESEHGNLSINLVAIHDSLLEVQKHWLDR